MKPRITLIVTFLLGMSSILHAHDESSLSRWGVGGALGMSYTSNTLNKSNQTALGRLSLGATLLSLSTWQTGIEIGVQSGTTFRLSLPKESIDSLGGVPIEVTMKPFLDVLAGLNLKPSSNVPMNLWLKGGAAFRMMQVDREEVNDLSQISPELQVGLGYEISRQATINLGYQVIWGQKPKLEVNLQNETAILQHIPMQQAVMLGFSYKFI